MVLAFVGNSQLSHDQCIIFYFSDRCATPEGAIVIGKRKTIGGKSQLFDGESEKQVLNSAPSTVNTLW